MSLYAKQAQSMVEYAIFLALVVAVFVAMQVYVRRGLQARLKDASDATVKTLNANYDTQYEPYYQDISKDVVGNTWATENMTIGGPGRRLSRGYNQAIEANQTQVDLDR